MHKCTSYGWDKLNLCPFYHFTFKCDLDFQHTRTNLSNGTSTGQGELCQIIKKSMYKCISYNLDKLKLRPFYHLTFECDLDLQRTWTNVSNGSSPQGEQLCQIILKSMHNCTSFDPDKSRLTHASTTQTCTYTELKL